TICAERNAINSAISNGEKNIVSVYLMNDEEKFIYSESVVSDNVKRFVKTREEDSRRLEVSGDFGDMLRGDIFYFAFMEPKEKLLPIYEFLKNKCNCLFQPDNYTDNWFLEVMPKAATKANGVLCLKEMVGADRLVVFGDGYNDMELFRVADESYAVANAVDELKNMATAVIGSCDEDAVARWLIENFTE
ncbi:MAG: HAD hydrolase family protein, partial [Ruminococcus sp.]|nr:HAD hydrolase family protein [Ruminococcus sp.]